MVSVFMDQNKRMETKHPMGVASEHLIAFQFGAVLILMFERINKKKY